ncbi:MAG TPA: response regulator transcription factor [Polyangia bacterium]|nr:response regulator transcription factor [Polyangia bacterium]
MSERPITLVLVDDHELFRAGMRAMFEHYPEFSVVGEAADAASAYATVERTRPDVAVVDVRLSGVDGITATRELVRRGDVRVAILSARTDPDYVAEALAAGALGYLVKDGSPDECIAGLRAVARGERVVPASISPAELNAASARAGLVDRLTRREREVFQLLVRGQHNQGIADRLSIAVKTVETHRQRILKKLDCHSIVDLVLFATRHDLDA